MTLCLCKRHNKRGLFNSVECVAPVINSFDLNALIHSHCLTLPLSVRGLTSITRVPAWQQNIAVIHIQSDHCASLLFCVQVTQGEKGEK